MTRLRTHSLFVEKTIQFMLLCGKISYRERGQRKSLGYCFSNLRLVMFARVVAEEDEVSAALDFTTILSELQSKEWDNVDSYLGVLEHFNFVNFKSTCWWNIQFQLFSHALKDKCIVWDSWEKFENVKHVVRVLIKLSENDRSCALTPTAKFSPLRFFSDLLSWVLEREKIDIWMGGRKRAQHSSFKSTHA